MRSNRPFEIKTAGPSKAWKSSVKGHSGSLMLNQVFSDICIWIPVISFPIKSQLKQNKLTEQFM